MIRRRKKGFTLIEIMVVIAIIGVLAAVLLPNVTGLIDKAKRSGAEADVQGAYTALLSYMDAKGDFPVQYDYNSTSNLRVPLRDYATWSSWANFLQDPWNRWMSYYYPRCYGYVGAIYSNGPNGTNQTWSCWWWRYYGFNGDDIGKSIKKL